MSVQKPDPREHVATLPLSSPFSYNALSKEDRDNQDDVSSFENQFPASYRVGNDEIRAPVIPDLDIISRELNVKRLHDIIRLLWLAGRPVPPRPLHYQLALGRSITITERMESHLVWGSGRIFLKPVPRYLLMPEFWSKHLSCERCCGSNRDTPTFVDVASDGLPCQHGPARACALGFLLSYVALITYESDFAIAKAAHLLPEQVTWPRWRRFVREMLADDSTNRLYTRVAPRFIYGELRLNRLNLIFFALQGPLSSGFVPTWHSFGSFYRDNSAWIITVAAYILLLLSAIQVGLGIDKLSGNEDFQTAAYGFTIFSMLAPFATLGLLVAFSIVLWAYNVMRTRQFEAKRARTLSRRWREEAPQKRTPRRSDEPTDMIAAQWV
ncbi:hypothetical protein QBC34DRAFT_58897 [Podospora aff. communis PSN243]|uniref:Uncharacterized protein n=1 Tax=Podospora aff. communis PSN243 TaxID=3040156 RepID=A0AAV9GUY4_9PEZI|nr:hypothetical protein QBC34DRAFT_58897 [Podospora aff. communis PSN243]